MIIGVFFASILASIFIPLDIKANKQNIIEIGTVVIDAGHGGLDGGVVGATGIKESQINLEIAQQLAKKLEKNQVKVIMTRNTKDALADSKKKDMAKRKEIISNSKADLVVSIHTNKFSDKTRCGTQVFFDDTLNGQHFARIMQSHLNDTVNKNYRAKNNYIALKGDFFITKCTPKPSIIIECGFISNANDERLLLDATFRNDLTDSISSVIISALAQSS